MKRARLNAMIRRTEIWIVLLMLAAHSLAFAAQRQMSYS